MNRLARSPSWDLGSDKYRDHPIAGDSARSENTTKGRPGPAGFSSIRRLERLMDLMEAKGFWDKLLKILVNMKVLDRSTFFRSYPQ